MAYTQENRLISISTPLGEDALLLQAFRGHEGISQLFRFELDLLAEDPAIPFEKMVGQKVTIALALADNSKRYINGFVSRFAQSGSEAQFTTYRAEVVPWLWFLTRTADCRIFQHMTVPDIIMQIFRDLGFSDVKNMLQGAFTPREYCVQYRETDFNFVSRLMEQYGIFYYFEHEENCHTLILGNSLATHQSCPHQARVRFASVAVAQEEEDVITRWSLEQEVRPGRYALTDYNFETPRTSLAATIDSTVHVESNGHYEIYDYPGEYEKKAQGDDLVKLRIEEEEAQHLIGRGASTCRTFIPGYRFALQEHQRRDMNTSYVLTDVQHSASIGENYVTGGGSAGDAIYTNHFTCIPDNVPYRPPRVTPKPVVQGPQTAVVVGKQDEELWVDKYGRVKVQFHWDREGKLDENSSCWIRVAQNWAGKRWGMMFIPRIGQEVIVDFLEGDPDQPIITGRVYNAETMPPYDLPAEQTKSTIKSLSSKGGDGFNELRFEDKKGDEQIFIHAEKNQDNRVKNDSLEWIGRDRHLLIKHDQLELVEGDKHLTVKGDHNEKVDGTVSLQAGMDRQEKVGMKHALDAGMEIHLKAGMNIVLEAGMSITLKAGGGFIVVGPAGVTISGTPVLINSGGAAGSGSGSSPENPQAPQEADTADPGDKARLKAVEAPPPAAPTPAPSAKAAAQATVLKEAAKAGTPFCEPFFDGVRRSG